MTVTLLLPDQSEVVVMPWEEFAEWFGKEWKQGEHIAVVAPTGEGKTTFQMRIAELRNWVGVLDAKGGDRTLDASPGFKRVTRWPLPLSVREDIKDGEPARLIIGKHVRLKRDRVPHRALLLSALEGFWAQRNWTVIIDEVQLLTDRRFFNLADEVVEMLIAARDRGLSVVAALQRVSIGQATGGASGTLGDQSTWTAVAYTRDDRMVQRYAELLGRPVAEVRTVVTSLPRYTWCIVGRNPRAPYVVTRPPVIGRSAKKAEAHPEPSWRERWSK